MRQVSTEELERLAAELEVKEFVCPECGSAEFDVNVDWGFTVLFVNGQARQVSDEGPTNNDLTLQCACGWEETADQDTFGQMARRRIKDALQQGWKK